MWLAMAVSLGATAAPARAGTINTASTNVVIQSYTGERLADADRLLSPVLDELARRKYNYDNVARTFDVRQSGASIGTRPLPPDFAAQIDRGYNAWISGDFTQALSILNPLVDLARQNAAAIAKDPTLHDAVSKGLVATALSQYRNGDPNAAAITFGELVRAFPNLVVPRAIYGAEAADLFAKVQHDVHALGHGTLAVKLAGADTGDVFIDENYIGTPVTDLPPGDYRVFAKSGSLVSRVHRVTIHANEKATLAIDIAFDAAVRTAPWTGLEFATAADREAHEGAYAQQFATSIGAGAIIVVGIDQVRGRPSVVASLVSMQNGRELRRASVPVDPDPSSDRLRALASYVAGDEPQSGIEVLGDSGPVTTAGAAPSRPSSGGPWKWVVGAGAVVALGVGGTLVALDGSCASTQVDNRPCSDLRSTATPGLVVGGVGVALAAVAIYMFVRHGETPPSGATAFVTPEPGGAIAGYATRW